MVRPNPVTEYVYDVACPTCEQPPRRLCADLRSFGTRALNVPHPARPMAALVKAVKDHATEHYTEGGWDVIVECWSDEEIAERIGRSRTVKSVIAKFEGLVAVWADRQADARNSAF